MPPRNAKTDDNIIGTTNGLRLLRQFYRKHEEKMTLAEGAILQGLRESGAEGIPDGTLMLRLAAIVEQRSLELNPTFFQNRMDIRAKPWPEGYRPIWSSQSDAFRDAAQALTRITKDTVTAAQAITDAMDLVTMDRFFRAMRLSIDEFKVDLTKSIRFFRRFSQALDKSVKTLPKQKGRGRPKSQFVPTAEELIALWEDATKTTAKIPKRRKNERAATEHSTHFIHLCLQMIDPNISLAKTETAIRNALTLRRTTTRHEAIRPGGTRRLHKNKL